MNPLDALLAAIGAAPALPGARCRGRHQLFDSGPPGKHHDTRDARHAQALALCNRCPSLRRCEDWIDSLPKSRRPAGVVAGRINYSNPWRTTEADQ